MNRFETNIINYSNAPEAARKAFAELPAGIIAAEKIYYGPDVNIFIDDLQTRKDPYDRSNWQYQPSDWFWMPLADIARRRSRDFEVWETPYLQEKLSSVLYDNNILGSGLYRETGKADSDYWVFNGVRGCGAKVASELSDYLAGCEGTPIPVEDNSSDLFTRGYGNVRSLMLARREVAAADSTRPRIFIDDVIKTGKTMYEYIMQTRGEIPAGSVFATWAMPAVKESDLAKPEYYWLNELLNVGPIYAGIVYAGQGVTPAGLPLNSLSTLVDTSTPAAAVKGAKVRQSLAAKYFGPEFLDIFANYQP